MALTAGDILIGPVGVSINGTDMGFTTTDGIDFTLASLSMQAFRGAQSTVIAKRHRSEVDAMVKVTFAQLSLANLKTLLDTDASIASSALTPTFQPTPNALTLVLTGAGPSGGTRVVTGTVNVTEIGSVKMSNDEFSGLEVTFGYVGNPSANSYYTIQDSASSDAAPAPASYQKIVSGAPTTITDDATAVAVTSQIQATFNVAIRADQLTSGHFILKENDGNVAVACTLAFGTTTGATDYTKVVLTPAASLDAATEYELVIPQGLLSVDGIPSTALAAIQFTTS